MSDLQISWENIRPIDNSRQLGFEELCCQLARHDVPEDADFRRKGSPDAGVECLARVDGEVWGWQAKFFTSPPNSSQWGQIDESVETALDRHHDLTRYYVCLPLDRADPRMEGRSYMMDRWDERVDKWSEWAGEREVEFIYWGQSELVDRLTLEEHRGRLRYWFDRGILSRSWFQAEVDRAIEIAGPRYTPDVHVDLSITEHFDALGRTDRFFQDLKQHHREIDDELSSVRRATSQSDLEFQKVEEAAEATEQVLDLLLEIEASPTAHLPFGELSVLAEEASQPASEARDLLFELETGEASSEDTKNDGNSERPDIRRATLSDLLGRLDDLKRECDGIDAPLANEGLMLLIGEAGKGKTHLFCDVARQRLGEGRPTVLLMGQQFTSTDDPWTQALRLLGLSDLSPDEFVGALEARAQAAGEKALFMVDALNEGRGRGVWRPHLSGFVDRLLSSEWIAVALSVRSSYVQFTIPDGFLEEAVCTEHSGFEGREYDAVRTFFDHYGIEQPSTPLLAPEFQNPLFLKVLCEGLSGQGITRLPRGVRGITVVFDLFLDAVNDTLSSELEYPERRKYVHKAVHRIAEEMADRRQEWLPREEAERIVEDLPVRPFESSLYLHMVSEGVFAEDIRYHPEEEEQSEVTYFVYQRFADHAIVDELLNEFEEVDSAGRTEEDVVVTLEELFRSDGPLHFLVDGNEWTGLISALCVQIPERFGVELSQVAPQITERHGYPEALFQSIVWRDTDAFSENSIDAINQAVWNEHYFRRSLDTLVQVATIPDHPFNADFLHSRLVEDAMPDRDEWWSSYLHRKYQSEGKVHRLVEWALDSNLVEEAPEETVRLCAVTLTWFLTSSNRFLRDRATKALVRLLNGRLNILRGLIRQFADLDDPYVQERLYAVAHGCVMKSHDEHDVGTVAETVYVEVFRDGSPEAHILLRDYARGVVDRALHLGSEIGIDEKRIRPPYGSEWPEIPSEDEISVYDEQPIRSEETGSDADEELSHAQRRIVHSVMGWDFARYVIGTNTDRPNWLDIPMSEPTWRSPQEELTAFIESLPEESRQRWKDFQRAEKEHKQITWSPPIFELANEEQDEEETDAQQLSEALQSYSMQEEVADDRRQAAWEKFLDTLQEDKQERAISLWQEKQDSHAAEEIPYFDLSKLQRWILKRVFDLGWTEDRFGRFDERVDRLDRSREARKPERVGKKYQWIAYHEIMARLADNFHYRESLAGKEPDRQYRGPWQEGLHLRDIDPSCLIQLSKDEVDSAWWIPQDYDNWQEDREAWIHQCEGLPSVRELLIAVDQVSGTRYARLSGLVTWSEPVPPERDRFDEAQSEVWFKPLAYLVRESEVSALSEWAREQDLYGRRMPEPGDMHDLYLGEYCWSPAAEYYRSTYSDGKHWNMRSTPVPIHIPTTEYVQGFSSHDTSYEEGGTIRLPSCLLREKMELRWSGTESRFIDDSGEVRAFDPRSVEGGPSTCLVEAESLIDMLDREDMAIFWTLVGGKRILAPAGDMSPTSKLKITGCYTLQDRSVQGFTAYNLESYRDGEATLETIQTDQNSFML